MNNKNILGIRLDKFTRKYFLLGGVMFLLLSLITSFLPEIVYEAICPQIFIVIFGIYILLLIGVKIYQNILEIRNNSENKSILIIKYVLLSSVIIFIGLVWYYHSTGPRGATNDCYKNFKLVSCEKQTEKSIYGNDVYTCLRAGKKSLVNCNKDGCTAICER